MDGRAAACRPANPLDGGDESCTLGSGEPNPQSSRCAVSREMDAMTVLR